jgi:hypothetical protein
MSIKNLPGKEREKHVVLLPSFDLSSLRCIFKEGCEAELLDLRSNEVHSSHCILQRTSQIKGLTDFPVGQLIWAIY